MMLNTQTCNVVITLDVISFEVYPPPNLQKNKIQTQV